MGWLLAIDPGVRAKGMFAVHGRSAEYSWNIVETKNVKAPASKALQDAEDFWDVRCGIANFIEDLERSGPCHGIVYESANVGNGIRALKMMQSAFCAIWTAALVLDYKLETVTPGDIRLELLGERRGYKDKLQEAIRERFGEICIDIEDSLTKGRAAHVIDALGVMAAACANREGLSSHLGKGVQNVFAPRED